MALPKKIFLVGLPASGKSTTGKRLADLLHYLFLDLDDIIENQEGRKIPEIIKTDGEDYFRMVEHYALTNSLSRHEKFIMSTGGGTPCYHDNMTLIKKHGTIVFLDIPLDKIVKRLLNTPGRPLVKSSTPESLFNEMGKLLEKRLLYYSQAHYTVGRSAPEDILQMIKN